MVSTLLTLACACGNIVSPRAAGSDVEEEYVEERRENREHEDQQPKDKQKGRKSYTVGGKLSAVVNVTSMVGTWQKLQETVEYQEATCSNG